MLDRSESRELVLLCLHQWDQQGDEEGQLATSLIEERASSPEVSEYAHQLLKEYLANHQSIDDQIEKSAENWRLARMAVVDRSILRLATTEMEHIPAVPAKVSIDEAIELAKKYSTEKSGSFVNGILDRILTDKGGANGAR